MQIKEKEDVLTIKSPRVSTFSFFPSPLGNLYSTLPPHSQAGGAAPPGNYRRVIQGITSAISRHRASRGCGTAAVIGLD